MDINQLLSEEEFPSIPLLDSVPTFQVEKHIAYCGDETFRKKIEQKRKNVILLREQVSAMEKEMKDLYEAEHSLSELVQELKMNRQVLSNNLHTIVAGKFETCKSDRGKFHDMLFKFWVSSVITYGIPELDNHAEKLMDLFQTTLHTHMRMQKAKFNKQMALYWMAKMNQEGQCRLSDIAKALNAKTNEAYELELLKEFIEEIRPAKYTFFKSHPESSECIVIGLSVPEDWDKKKLNDPAIAKLSVPMKRRKTKH